MKKLLLPVFLTLSGGVCAAELFIAKGSVSGACNDQELIRIAKEVATEKAKAHFGSRVRVHRIMNENVKSTYGTYWNVCLEQTAFAEISFRGNDSQFASFEVFATGSHRDEEAIAKDNAVLKATLACGTKIKRLSEWRIGNRKLGYTATANFECLED